MSFIPMFFIVVSSFFSMMPRAASRACVRGSIACHNLCRAMRLHGAMRLRALQFTNRAAPPSMKQLSAEWTDYLTQRKNCRRFGVGMMRRGRLARGALRTASRRSPRNANHDVDASGLKLMLIRLHRSHAAALQKLMRAAMVPSLARSAT